MRFTLITLLAISLSLIGCKNSEKSTENNNGQSQSKPTAKEVISEMDGEQLFVSIEKSGCFGTCPIFKMSINYDGSVKYIGRKYVEYEGVFEGKVRKSTLEEIGNLIDSNKIMEMDSAYVEPKVTDLPTVTTVINYRGEKKKIVGMIEMPEGLKVLNNYLTTVSENIELKRVK